MKSTRVVVMVAAVAVLGLPGQVQAAAKAARASDFNGDGRIDLAVGDIFANSSKVRDSGAVTITYGGGARRQVVTADSPGVPGRTTRSGHWGRSLASADFDRDGYADLVVGGYGPPTVVYGSKKGLSRRAVRLPGKIAGADLKVADLDHNGKADLVAAPSAGFAVYYNVGKGKPRLKAYDSKSPEAEHQDIGNHPLPGDFNGDGYKDMATFYVRDSDVKDRRTRLELRLGSRKGLGAPHYTIAAIDGSDVRSGDFNGDGVTDLISRTGMSVIYGSRRKGFSAPVTINKSTPGWPKGEPMGPVEYADTLLTTGDVNGDGRTDVAFSSPDGLGRVLVLYGSKKGLGLKGVQVFTGSNRAKTQFGRAISLVDLTGDRRAELVVHESLEHASGTVYVFRNVKGKLTKAKPKRYTGARIGMGADLPEGQTTVHLP
jgi:hypothetical protein